MLANASHAISEKGKKGSGKISISTIGKEKDVTIKVSDYGKGIPEEIQTKFSIRILQQKMLEREKGKDSQLHMILL